MNFNSYEYLIFFFVVTVLYFRLKPEWRRYLLLAASYYFYMKWQPSYVLILLSSTIVDYWSGLRMHACKPGIRKNLYLLASLVVNIGLLFSFKDYGLFRHTLILSGNVFQQDWSLPILDVLLPVGVSFIAFQSLSYTIDVYRGRMEPEPSFTRFALYVSFFPQLVAGPIERATHLLPQLRKTYSFETGRVVDGLKMITWGMFKKVVVADRLAVIANTVYSDASEFNGAQLLLATVLFGYQIYCDFSGYSDIAIGSAKVLGVDLMTNFDRPYISRSIAEFWRRWHISLSTWFRDYLYIPLGGNRCSRRRWVINTMVVFLVSGLWHGANYTFVVWGFLHGVYILVGESTKTWRASVARAAGLDRIPHLHSALQRLTVFSLVTFSWIFFRAQSLNEALAIVRRLPSGWGELSFESLPGFCSAMGTTASGMAVALLLIVFVEWISHIERGNQVRELMNHHPWYIRWPVYALLVLAILDLGVPTTIPFIYFQF